MVLPTSRDVEVSLGEEGERKLTGELAAASWGPAAGFLFVGEVELCCDVPGEAEDRRMCLAGDDC